MKPPENPEAKPPGIPTKDLPSYELEEEDEPRALAKWIHGWRLLLVVLLLGLTVGLSFAAKPLYQELKARRAMSLAGQAGQAIERGEMAKANTLLRQAALMAHADERVASLLVYHAARAGDLASVAALGQKLKAGEASTDEILVFGERSAQARRPLEAKRALEALPTTLPPKLALRRAALAAGNLQATGQLGDAILALRQALADFPEEDTLRLRLLLAQLLLTENSESAQGEAEPLLEGIASAEGKEALMALRLLAVSRAKASPRDPEMVESTVALLRHHPDSSAADELFLARLITAYDPSRQKEATEALISRLEEREASAADRIAPARWLIELEEYEGVLALCSAADAAEEPGALMARLDALSGLNRWDECDDLIDSNLADSLPSTVAHLFRARLATMRGREGVAEGEKRQLRQAMQFAAMSEILFVAGYAESVGWKAEAFTAWRILSSENPQAPEALRGQLRNFPASMSAEASAALSKALLVLQPDDPSVRLSAAYLHLLAGQSIEKFGPMAEELLVADPSSTEARRVAALARLRRGQAAEGLAIWPADSEEESRWLILHAALLKASGQSDEAQEVMRSIDQSDLNKVDLDLFHGS